MIQMEKTLCQRLMDMNLNSPNSETTEKSESHAQTVMELESNKEYEDFMDYKNTGQKNNIQSNNQKTTGKNITQSENEKENEPKENKDDFMIARNIKSGKETKIHITNRYAEEKEKENESKEKKNAFIGCILSNEEKKEKSLRSFNDEEKEKDKSNDNSQKLLGRKKTKFEKKEDKKEESKKDEKKNRKKCSNFNTINGLDNKINLKSKRDKNINVNKKCKKDKKNNININSHVNKKKDETCINNGDNINIAEYDNISSMSEDLFKTQENRAFFEECDEQFDSGQYDISGTHSNTTQVEPTQNINHNSTINSSSLIQKMDNLNL